jgi:signal transduction histidine kinase
MTMFPGRLAGAPTLTVAWRGIRASVADDAGALAFVLGAVLLLALFRTLVVTVITIERVSPAEFAAHLGSDFALHAFAALVMFVVVQPVRRAAAPSGLQRHAVVAPTLLLAAAAAALLRGIWLAWDGAVGAAAGGGVFGGDFWEVWFQMFVRFGLVGGLLVVVAEFHRAEVRSLEAMRAADADRATLEQQTLQARLRTLEAQIEPHFLFNTLANLRRLYESDTAAGEAMLERLMRYLQMALPSMRSESSTLGREAELIEAYLELQRVRMGRRLAFTVDIAPALRGIEVPPMMLLTLVENAIKHGLAPLREGGRVDVGARLDGATLRLEVADTGRGFGGGTSGGGTGLANIRARLAAMFGSAAELRLAAQDPRGLCATIRLPLAPEVGAR